MRRSDLEMWIQLMVSRLQVFLSSAFLISLGVATLIVYLMNPPISKALEGGYVAASTIAGLIVGGLANLFPEITEYFGAVLGGICLSMWCKFWSSILGGSNRY